MRYKIRKLFVALGLVLVSAVVCPAQVRTIFSSIETPTQSFSNAQGVELGVKFRSDVSGAVTGIRFYKGPADTSQHSGSLWSSTGQPLATGTFTNESGAGWQQLNFSTAVSITADTTYVASYHTSSSFFADYYYYLNQGLDRYPLHALQNGVDGGNGVYVYGVGGAFPNQTYLGINYWVDVVFTQGRFVDNGDGTVTDNSTGLMWEKKTGCGAPSTTDIHCYKNLYTWSPGDPWNPDGTLFTDFLARMTLSTSSDGVTLANNCLAGHCDWRLPTIAELKTIVGASNLRNPCDGRDPFGPPASFPCIDETLFGPTLFLSSTCSQPSCLTAYFYWSSTTDANHSNQAWEAFFFSGPGNKWTQINKDDSTHSGARAVRGGK